MAHTYTPGLKVAARTVARRRRVLPLKGDVLVQLGQTVAPDDVVARTELPGAAELFNVATTLGVEPAELPSRMVKREGDAVQEGEVIARSKSLFGLLKSQATAKMSGVIEKVNAITGQVLVRGPSLPVEVKAYTAGRVIEVIEREGCVVETHGALAQGIFGVGGETNGPLVMACEAPGQRLTPNRFTPEMAGRIVVGGGRVTAEALKKAIAVGVRGVIAGGFDDKDLREFLGYDLGVAITGTERLGLTLIITEGFGDIDMAARTFDLFKAHAGRLACINGATQIRAGVIRPEVIIPSAAPADAASPTPAEAVGLAIGSPIRVVRLPHFGRLGAVSALPPEPQTLESGAQARVLEVDFGGGEKAIVPRANVELIES